MKTALHVIKGAMISSKCGQCNLVRSNSTWKYIRQKHQKPCQHFHVVDSDFICMGKPSCTIRFTTSKQKPLNICYSAATRLHPIEYTLGVLAISLNSLVLLTILVSKSLRSKPSFVLIANMAIGDLLVGAYSVAIATGHKNYVNIKQFRGFRYDQCPYIRSVLMLGQFIGISISFLVCIERYLATVHWRKPQLKLKLKSVLVALIICWVMAIAACLFLHYHNPTNITDNYMCVLVRDFSGIHTIVVGQALMIAFVFIYLIVIALYIRIYIFLRKTGNSVGVHRESTLVKRIGSMVVTNGVFFVGSNVLVVCSTLAVRSGQLASDPVIEFIVRKWIPPICMVLNACLDPLFYAYRNKKFSNAFNSILRSIATCFSSFGCVSSNGACTCAVRVGPVKESTSKGCDTGAKRERCEQNNLEMLEAK